MTYAHRLEFGTFLAPDSRTPEDPVELARLSEQLGYDLVTFPDRPHLPEHLDTWTLLSWVAGVTDRIRLAANVHSVPLRSPSVLARSAASLDLLSGGRVEHADGAGAHREAVEAMGGDGLPPAQAVDALSEAVDVVRALNGVAGAVTYSGEHHRLSAAQPTVPTPHEIPIWIGAAGPRMLRLIGEKADGWSATLAAVGVDGLAAGNRTIDAAARAAGRDPREIRRLLNVSGRFAAQRAGFLDGPAADWVSDLLPLAVDHGVGTFVLMSDDPATLTRFAHEVIPALRAAVDRAVPHGAAGLRVRPAAVLARRRDGIDYDAAPASLAEVVEPGDRAYHRLRSGYLRGGSPGIVLRASDAAQVADALAFARAHPDLDLSIRSAGHGVSGRSTNDGGIVVDVSLMNTVKVLDEETRRIRVGPGARWMEVAAALHPHGWALSSGDYGGVGVGGLATAGGIGYLAREHGLTIDHLRAVDMVLADGRIVRASDTENPDLFWAVRGAGANFGIVTSFEFEVDEVGDVGFAQLALDASDTAGFLLDWGQVMESAPRDLTSFIILGPPRRGRPAVAQVMAVVDSDDPDTVLARLTPIAGIAPLLQQQVRITPYAVVMANADDGVHRGRGEPVTRSGLLRRITPAFAEAAERFLATGAVHFFQIRSLGGAISDVDADATAYAHRDANFQVVAFGARRDLLDTLWEDLYPHFEGLYLSFESDPRPARLLDAFPPRTLARLRGLKDEYDPGNTFRDNFNITPALERSAP
ncbi:LLM class flavin-dependent oxidoreductase [Pseudonocardia petroleophila]|uniref:LLM class flavin-dependent oxidoreductase n=1 Tax=Pseudonocardia petroleophila TaxID=37331 RepID=UPI0035E600A7